jgi:hypothetical protein
LRVYFALELDAGTDPPSGRLIFEGTSEPFAGWLALAVALERTIDRQRPHQCSERPTDTHD